MKVRRVSLSKYGKRRKRRVKATGSYRRDGRYGSAVVRG